MLRRMYGAGDEDGYRLSDGGYFFLFAGVAIRELLRVIREFEAKVDQQRSTDSDSIAL